MQYKWHIFLANLDPVIGSEQGKTRPVIVISEEEINQILPVVNVLPTTSRKPNRRIYPNEVLIPASTGGLDKESIVLCYQIRAIDKKRLIRDMGKIEDLGLHEEIIDALCFQLGIIR
ncbi:PemK-like, MazF-like toxin of type II toxin-antitoxin system [uncultured archaeon]|nr:PemK-like, MazF-like toxin of type II toxin-antitoxin system [uncultured archaeon]